MRAQPSYIRTIKPNQNRSSSEYDTKAVLHQVKYLGLQENIRVRRAGFAYRNTFEKMVERFYLLSPATSYAGDYIWQGDSKSGCERILTDTGIAREEWQMGVTKAFIKNPETVRLADRRIYEGLPLIQLCSSSHSKPCVTAIGTIWPVVFSVHGVTLCVTSTSAPVVYSASGRITRRASSMPRSAITATRFSPAGRSAGVSVCWDTVASWEIIWISAARARLARNSLRPVVSEVSWC